MQIKNKGKTIYNGGSVIFYNNGDRTTIGENDNIIYHLKLNRRLMDGTLVTIDKLGYTGQTSDELMKQYASNHRGQGGADWFEQFFAIDQSFLESKFGLGLVHTYAKQDIDDLIRQQMVNANIVKTITVHDGTSVNSEGIDLLGKSMKQCLDELFIQKGVSIQTNSFIDEHVKKLNSLHSAASSGEAIVDFVFWAARAGKDPLALNILVNGPWTDMIASSKMLTTQSGLDNKLSNLDIEALKITIIDTRPKANLSLSTIKQLYQESCIAGYKRIWYVSGFDGDSALRKDIMSKIKNIPDSHKYIDIDEVDWATWRVLNEHITSLLNFNDGTPLVILKTGSKYGKVLVSIAETNIKNLIGKYSVIYNESFVTQQDLELEKIAGNPSMQHVLHKCDVHVELLQKDINFINKNFDSKNITGYAGAYACADDRWFTSLLDRFLLEEIVLGCTNQYFIGNLLNRIITDTIDTHYPTMDSVEEQLYTDRTIFGLQINTQTKSKKEEKNFERIIRKAYGDKYNIFGCSNTTRANLEDKVNDWLFDTYSSNPNIQFDTTNQLFTFDRNPNDQKPFILLNPGWPMLSRSFTQGLLDVTLELKNTLDSQSNNRTLSNLSEKFNNGLNLDGKKKLVGISIHVPFVQYEGTTGEVYDEYLSNPKVVDSTPEQRTEYNSVLNHWKFANGEDNCFKMNQKDKAEHFDLLKATKIQIMTGVDWDKIYNDMDFLRGVIKSSGTSTPSGLEIGNKGTHPKGSKSEKNKDADKKRKKESNARKQVETLIDSIEFIWRYAEQKNIHHLSLDNALSILEKDPIIGAEFTHLTGGSINICRTLYNTMIDNRGKNNLNHIYIMNRRR